MKNLYILEIQLLSQKEKKAKRVVFDKKRTLIQGKNHTGKSSLIKSIYWTFGAEPVISPKFQSANIISLVKFELNGIIYEILRDGKLFGIFDDKGKLIEKFTSVTSQLAPYLGNLFDFNPLFEATSSGFIVPPPAFLFLPYYIDQDKSWTASWSSFKSLKQIKQARNQSVMYHSGLRPNEYYHTKRDINVFTNLIDEIDKERKLTSKILQDVKSKLSQANFNIDLKEFKDEITKLLVEYELLMTRENKLKDSLHNLYHVKATYDSQIEIVKVAIQESHKDLVFATDYLSQVISCPTCGAEYDNSFTERFEIAVDEQKSKDLLLELIKDSAEIEEKIKKQYSELSTTTGEVLRISEILEEKKSEVKLKDVIESAGKNQVREIFSDRHEELSNSLFENVLEKEKLEHKLKSFESKERRKTINEFYLTKMTSFLKKLDVHTLDILDYKSLTTTIENKETGSSMPRALIAYYFTFFHLMKEFSTSAYCPLIIDSPNQQDQDVEHIDKIMGFINSNQPNHSQMILGLVDTYGEDFNCHVVELNEKYSLLQKKDYNEIHENLIHKQQSLWF